MAKRNKLIPPRIVSMRFNEYETWRILEELDDSVTHRQEWACMQLLPQHKEQIDAVGISNKIIKSIQAASIQFQMAKITEDQIKQTAVSACQYVLESNAINKDLILHSIADKLEFHRINFVSEHHQMVKHAFQLVHGEFLNLIRSNFNQEQS